MRFNALMPAAASITLSPSPTKRGAESCTRAFRGNLQRRVGVGSWLMPRFRSVLRAGFLTLLVLSAPLLRAASSPKVVVEIAPAKIERRTFDPANPPAAMPKLTPPEVGTCVYRFGCSTEMQAEGTSSRSGLQPGRVTEVLLQASLEVTLWTPRGGPAKILAHEEAHREIAEFYYDNAEKIGRELAQRTLGTRLKTRTKKAMEAELDALQKRVIREFLRETATRCDYAQARFDAITEHSMNPISESAAMARAIAAEESAYAQTGSGRSTPATAASEPSTGSAAASRRYPPTRPAR